MEGPDEKDWKRRERQQRKWGSACEKRKKRRGWGKSVFGVGDPSAHPLKFTHCSTVSAKSRQSRPLSYYFSEMNKSMPPAPPQKNDARPQSIGHLARTQAWPSPALPVRGHRTLSGVCRLQPGTFHDCTPGRWACLEPSQGRRLQPGTTHPGWGAAHTPVQCMC